jgi:hypothetical protein
MLAGMSHQPMTRPSHRDWTVPILVGAIALVILLVLCALGGTAAFLAFRGKAEASPGPAVTSAPSITAAPPSRSPVDCLRGDWEEVSYVGTSVIYGVRVQLSGKGILVRFAPDGKATFVLNNIVISGTAQGSRYEVTHRGSLTMNYLADSTTINYSNPVAEGTTTWKIDGKVTDSEAMTAALKPKTYRCLGDELRIFGEDSASELTRIIGPGTPV